MSRFRTRAAAHVPAQRHGCCYCLWPVSSSLARPAVLVADDEPLTRWALSRSLECHHLDISLAGTRDEVCDLLDTREFQVIVLANELGHHSMVDVLSSLSRDGRSRGLVILYDGEQADEYASAFPFAVLLQKPFGLDAVTSAVEGFLEPRSEAV